MPVQVVIFLALFIVIAFLSRRSLRSPGSHGFFRFLAWELMLGQLALVIGVWFRNPFAWHQLISWFLLLVSLLPLAFGLHQLSRRGGAAEGRRKDPALFGFEKTTKLVTNGVYRYIRHPLYSSLLFAVWGIFFKGPSFFGAALALAASLFLVLTALADGDFPKRRDG